MANLLGADIGTNYKGILNLDSTINTPLDATLRAVTDGEGDASPLQLSTTSVSVGSISGARLGIKGSGTTSATTALLVQNSAGVELFKVIDQANSNTVSFTSGKIGNMDFVSGNVIASANLRIVASSGGVAINKDYSASAANTMLHVKGSGTTSATTALLVQNSAGSDALQVRDDRVIIMAGMPTSATGLPAGALWNNSGIINIV